jgi:hypothetical protein
MTLKHISKKKKTKSEYVGLMLQSIFMQNFSSLASEIAKLLKFWKFLPESFRIIQKILNQISKNSKSEYAVLNLN